MPPRPTIPAARRLLWRRFGSNLSFPCRFCNLLIPQTGRKCQKAYTSLSIVQLSYNLLVEKPATIAKNSLREESKIPPYAIFTVYDN
jgi:hypothetical protein